MLYEIRGVGFPIKQADAVEPIGNKQIEKRVAWIEQRNITELQKACNEWLAQAERERIKSLANQVKGSNYSMRFGRANNCLQMAQAYAAVIKKMLEENPALCIDQNSNTYPTGRRRLQREGG